MPLHRKPAEAVDLDPEGFVDEDDYTIDCDNLDDIELLGEVRGLEPHSPE